MKAIELEKIFDKEKTKMQPIRVCQHCYAVEHPKGGLMRSNHDAVATLLDIGYNVSHTILSLNCSRIASDDSEFEEKTQKEMRQYYEKLAETGGSSGQGFYLTCCYEN